MDRPAIRVGSPLPITPRNRTSFTSYESLLNAFGTQRSPTSVTQARRSAGRPAANNLPSAPLSPTSDTSAAAFTPSPKVMVPVKTPVRQEPAKETQPSRQPLRMSLRPRTVQLPSDKTHQSPRAGLRSSARKENKIILTSDALPATRSPVPRKIATARRQIRNGIAVHTRVKQDSFLAHHKDLFIPLLPENSYVSKLGDSEFSDEFVPYKELDEAPKGVTATLKPYQMTGLSFLAHMNDNGMPCMLGDEMGLGKTLQTLSLFQLLEERRQSRQARSAENRPYLVVCPLSVLSSWVSEARRWTPGLKVLRFHGPKVERDHLKRVALGNHDRFGNETAKSKKRKGDRRRASTKQVVNVDSDDEDEDYKLIITSYETFVSEQGWFKTAFVWRYIVLDEGHKIKNSNSNVSTALQGLRAEYRLLLTGTPLQNDLLEMWSLVHWLLPDVFTEKTADLFKNSFDLSKGKVDTTVMNNARNLLELLMLRRMKNSPGVNLNLPPKEEMLLYVPLTPLQRFWYLRLLTRAGDALLNDLFSGVKDKEKDALQQDLEEAEEIKALEKVDAQMDDGLVVTPDVWKESRQIMQQGLEFERNVQGKPEWKKLMNLVMQLRKCCCHPYLLPHVQPDPYLLGDHIVTASGKFIVLEKLLRELILKRQKKVLIFSSFTSTLDYCEDLFAVIGGRGESFRYLRFDGGTGRARRNLDIRLFNDKSSEFKAMLISTKAGGLGINLTAATEVIFLDEEWNPQITLQAEARAHRIGQTQPVTIYKLCTQGTVEEQMMGRIRKKLYLSAKITESMKSVHDSPKASKKDPFKASDDTPSLDTTELMSLVRRGAQTLTHPEIDVTDMLSWDFDTIIEKCRDRPSDPYIGDGRKSVVDEQKWLSSMERVETAIFDGRRIQRQRDDDDGAKVLSELVRDDRRKGKNTTVMVDGYAINKQSMGCADWEAVPTMAGKDPSLKSPPRAKKKAIENQDYCQVCWDGGDILVCSLCPRSIHVDCLEQSPVNNPKGANFNQFSCPQHGCADCSKKTAEAGGLLYRCRFCPSAWCEDCIPFDRVDLVDYTLPEYEILGFGEVQQAFYIKCHQCRDLHEEDPGLRAFCDEQAVIFKEQYDAMLAKHEAAAANNEDVKMENSRASSSVNLTDATSIEESTGLSMPYDMADYHSPFAIGGSRMNSNKRPSTKSLSAHMEYAESFTMMGSKTNNNDTVEPILTFGPPRKKARKAASGTSHAPDGLF